MDHERVNGLIQGWFGRALIAVDPAMAVERAIADLPSLAAGPLPVVLAIGKAAGAMTSGFLAAVPGGIACGIVITKSLSTVGELPASVDVYEAGHPIPDQRTIRATEAALAMLHETPAAVPVVVLISGGGSALFESPVDGVSLADIATLTAQMLRAGATINQLNAVRSRLSRVKQGGLVNFVRSDDLTTLVLSDVIGNDLSTIASGPTVLPIDPLEPATVIDALGLRPSVPIDLLDRIETPRSQTSTRTTGSIRVVADNDVAVDAFATAAGERVIVDPAWRQRSGEARSLGREWVGACLAAPDDVDILVGGGEATVTVRGDGIGGRNTEFAVAAALELDRLDVADWVVASLATDGDDGPTGATGGIVSRRSVQAARDAGIDPAEALAANDTRRVLEATGGLVVTGPTGTNVNDLYVAVRVR